MSRVKDSMLQIVSGLSGNIAAGPVSEVCAAVLVAAATGGVIAVSPAILASAGIYLTLFLGSTFVSVCRSKRADAAQAKQFARLEHALKTIKTNQDEAYGALVDLAVEQQWVREALANETSFKAAWENEVKNAFVSLKLDTTALQESLHEIAVVEFDTNTRVRNIETGVDDLAKKLDQFIESTKQAGVDPTTQKVPPEVLAAAHELIKSKDAREKAIAAIVLKQWQTALQEIETLNTSPAIDEVFKNKTIEGDFYYAQSKFDEAVDPYEAALALRKTNARARINLALALSSSLRGDVTKKKMQAIDICEGTLKLDGITYYQLATTLNILGNTWKHLPTGNKTNNLKKTIDYCHKAIDAHIQADDPFGWAITLNNLGTAWRELPTGNRAENIKKSISYFQQAFFVLKRSTAPLEWARVLHNLGNAWLDLPTGNNSKNSNKALCCLQEALKERTRDIAPMDWALTQNSLGLAWASLPGNNGAGNLINAANCYHAALEVYTRQTAPIEWARTKINLGSALRQMPYRNNTFLTRKAIDYFHEALDVVSPANCPFIWALAQNNLGNAWASLAAEPRQIHYKLLQRAMSCYEQSLSICTIDAYPVEYAQLKQSLGITRRIIIRRLQIDPIPHLGILLKNAHL